MKPQISDRTPGYAYAAVTPPMSANGIRSIVALRHDADDCVVAEVAPPNDQSGRTQAMALADAKFLAHAANCFGDLLVAVKALLREHDCLSAIKSHTAEDRWPTAAALARSAIAKAEDA